MNKVAIVTRQIEKSTGAARVTHGQIRLFQRMGWQVDVFSEFVDKDEVRRSGGRPHRLLCWPLKGYRRRLWFARRAQRRIGRGGFDLVVGHGEIFTQNVVFIHNCVHKAHQLIHGAPLPADHEVGRIHDELLSRGRFDVVIANSQLMADELSRRYSIDARRIHVIHPGYDAELFRAEDRPRFREAGRRELGAASDEVLVGLITSGNFKKRNVSLYLKAIAALPGAVRARARFVVVGKESNLRTYSDEVSRLGLSERVRFLGPTDDIQKYDHALDVFCLPAKWEEFGLVVTEAMSTGLPVVVSDHVGAAELLEGPSREMIFRSENAQDLMGRLERLIVDADLRERLGAINRATAVRYTERQQTEKLKKLLQELGIFSG